MNKISAKPLSGFIELLPKQQLAFDFVCNKLKSKLKLFGFVPLDLSVIERQEVLIEKNDENDTQKQIYLFEKGDNKLGLRYDATVGFSRFISGNANDLVFPFRRFQLGKNFRGERPQFGRYREFYQLDFDIISENDLDISYEFEIINLIDSLFTEIKNYTGEYVIKIGSRKILNDLFDFLEIPENKRSEILILIDKKSKISEADFKVMISEIIDDKTSQELLNLLKDYKKLFSLSSNLKKSVEELMKTEEMLKSSNVKNYEIDLSIVRGLGYYTGIVFETYLLNNLSLGSVCGGGRYDNLCDKFTSRKFVGIGGAIGLSRLFVPLLDDSNFLSLFDTSSVDVVIIAMEDEDADFALKTALKMRQENIKVVCEISALKFKKKLEYANKLSAKYIIIVGELEREKNVINLKEMATGKSELLSFEQTIERLK